MSLAIYKWNGDDKNYLQYTWRSKLFILPREVNFPYGRLILDPDFYQAILETLDIIGDNQTIFTGDIGGALRDNTLRSTTLRGDLLTRVGDYDLSTSVTITIYEDDEIKTSVTIDSTDKIFTFPKGYVLRRPVIQITGYVPVYGLILAESIPELQGW